MAGVVSTSIKIKGRIVRIARSYDTQENFKAALSEIGKESRRLRDADEAENKSVKRAYRKKKRGKAS